MESSLSPPNALPTTDASNANETSPPTTSKSTSRTTRACEACRRRKIRCNGAARCQQCSHLGLRCIYSSEASRRSRKNAAHRGAVIDAYRKITSTSRPPGEMVPIAPLDGTQGEDMTDGSSALISTTPTPTSSSVPVSPVSIRTPDSLFNLPPLPPVIAHDSFYFANLLPDYASCVYPVNPVVTESEVTACIARMHTDPDAASFLYAYAAVTINLTQSDSIQRAPDIRAQITALVARAIELRRPFSIISSTSAAPTVLRCMGSIFIEICLMGLRRVDLAFYYLREAISILHMLQIDPSSLSNTPNIASPSSPNSTLSLAERARRQRLYWECYIHERFMALSDYKPPCLDPLPTLPDHDPSLSPSVEHGWNHIIQTFLLIDKPFLTYWISDRASISSAWIEHKHRQLEDSQWTFEVSQLSPMQRADLIITRQWLRTLVWQMAMSNILLTSSCTSPTAPLSLSLPLYLSSELRHFLTSMSHEAIGIHGSGILNKLFEITNTIVDVVIHLPQAEVEDTLKRVDDLLFLKRFLFSFPRFEDVHRQILMEKLERMREVYPSMEEMEVLFASPGPV